MEKSEEQDKVINKLCTLIPRIENGIESNSLNRLNIQFSDLLIGISNAGTTYKIYDTHFGKCRIMFVGCCESEDMTYNLNISFYENLNNSDFLETLKWVLNIKKS